METLMMALFVVMFAAIPSTPRHQDAEPGPQLALEKAEKNATSEKHLRQQSRMRECNEKGDERKKLLSPCLKGKELAKRSAPQSG
jgi:hypothetical protein